MRVFKPKIRKILAVGIFLASIIWLTSFEIPSVQAITDVFNTNLRYGDSGTDVRNLQDCLKSDPTVYPEGLVTGWFGPLTKRAVIRFQEKYAEEILKPWGLIKGSGFVGSTTRAKLNMVCKKEAGPTPITDLSPSLVSPINDFLTGNLTPRLVWKEVSGAKIYEWVIADQNNKVRIASGKIEHPSTFVIVPPGYLSRSETYKWWLKACSDTKCSKWATANFKTPLFPSPTPISPLDDSSFNSLTPKLEWLNAPDAGIYNWVISGVAEGTTTEPFVIISPGKLDYKRLYSWQIRTCLDASFKNCGNWSEKSWFKTLPKPFPIPNYSLPEMERNIHEIVNKERISKGLPALKWNSELANVAREHSKNLATENKTFTDPWICPIPLMHHEGLDFGLNFDDRLKNRGIYYFNGGAENITLIEMGGRSYSYIPGLPPCLLSELEYPSSIEHLLLGKTDEGKVRIIREEILKRTEFAKDAIKIEWKNIEWRNQNEIEEKTVKGWMDSPGHKENILTSEFDEAGIGIARVNHFLFITQVFIQRLNCGYKAGPCCEEPGYYPFCYIPLDCVSGICR